MLPFDEFHQNIVTPSPMFNPEGNDAKYNRYVWLGNTTNLMNLNNVKYDWALALYKQMKEQFWIPQKFDLTADVTDYKELTTAERRAFNGVLSYLTFLDSIQTYNLTFIRQPITAPEISMCLSEQISQEATHNMSYQFMIESLIPTEDRNAVYDFWRTDKVLYDRCKYIAKLYQNYIDDRSLENYYISLVADYMLEGLYFYSGFILFYTLASRSLMSGSADIIKTINRDELSHVRIFQKLLPEAKKELLKNSDRFEDKIYEMVDHAVKQEILWANHIIGDDVLGMSLHNNEQYVKYLGDLRLKTIGLKPLYNVTTNPYAHLEKFADLTKDASSKANFFESGVTAYNMASAIEGWDDF